MIDIHCHLERMDNPEQIVDEARKRGMSGIITSLAEPEGVDRMLTLHETNKGFVHLSVGFHPHAIADFSEEEIQRHAECIRGLRYDICAVGEIGLDYKDGADALRQQEVFELFLDVALEMDKPVVIHCREAFPDVLRILKEHNAHHVIFHCFSGSEGVLKTIMKEPEWYISFATNICYTKKHPRLAALVPLNRMLLETDSPWLDPDVPAGQERGLTNRPWKIQRSAEVIAKIKGFSIEEVLSATTENARRIFKFV